MSEENQALQRQLLQKRAKELSLQIGGEWDDSLQSKEQIEANLLGNLDKADPELIKKFDELQIPVSEQKRLANVVVDGVLDSVCIVITHRKELEKVGVIFCSISEAIREYPDLVIETGQFERTLIVADDRSFVEYLEGCTAPSYDRNQLHAAVVEL
ncbi:hypothetical protein LOK49_LG09G01581 [Camellia lanceoleosa]|uniref:Uncharacterized protein n=1 Tax=Camellia lanceoleosa TaxID=1840588 RepID=A0ACC0GKL1_9ERIC|nr:hypothetical protein LOK49_LG09G01581 [Camellia lanceoleosa]